MAYIHARRTIASSLLRALSFSSSSSFSSSYSSSSSSIASRSRFAFSVLTKQAPLVPHSLKFSIRFQTSAPDGSPAEESSEMAEESSKTAEESSETADESFDMEDILARIADGSLKLSDESSQMADESSKAADEASKEDSGEESEKKKIILEGCDLEHWLVIMDFPKDKKLSEEEMVNTYVKTLAEVVGSEEEAKKKIYSVSTTTYTGFGAEVSEELSTKLKGLPDVLWVLPDSYMDIVNKDYGGDLFVDGKVIPRPKYRYPERKSAENNPGQKNDRRNEFQNENRRPTQRQNRTRGQRG